jgi:hypothetical protein
VDRKLLYTAKQRDVGVGRAGGGADSADEHQVADEDND